MSTRLSVQTAALEAPYRNASLPINERVTDLLSRMTLKEKAGLLFHNMICPGPVGELAGPLVAMGILDTHELLKDKLMSHFNLIGPITDPKLVARWNNSVQQYVLDHTRLGIPVTLSSDPRHHFSTNVGTSFRAGVMSQWPETLAFGALRSPGLVRRFADVARQEYLAVGLRVSLHPQADLSTEYRWARVNTTFGEDSNLAAELVAAYIDGFQSAALSESMDGRESVATMTKHFPGAGPQMNGEDSHFVYGREAIYPGGNFEYHLEPFRKAIKAGTRQIMPAYAMPVGTKYEEVGFAFNKGVITGLLREELGFTGIICTDWGLVTDAVLLGQDMPARAWGCEHLSELERVVKILDAGCDQIGGESRPELVISAVKQGLVSQERLDASVARVLREKFVLGLFDDKRFVDVSAAEKVVGSPEFTELGKIVQRAAFTILTNGNDAIPLSQSTLGSTTTRFYIEGVDTETLERRGITVVSTLEDADVALLRIQCPHEPRPGGFEAKFHSGSLELPDLEVARLAHIIRTVPITVLDVYLDRPAVLTPLINAQEQALAARGLYKGGGRSGSALVVNFGADSEAFLDVCFGSGNVSPQGKLPFDLPRSMAAASQSREDMPFDSEDPLFHCGHGLRYRADEGNATINATFD